MLGLAIPPSLLVGASTFAAVELTGAVRLLAAILAILAALSTVIGVIYGAKWKAAHAAEAALNEALEDRLRVLAHDRDDLVTKLDAATDALTEANRTIARLEALPNLQAVLEMMTHTFERIMRRVEELHVENRTDGDRRLQRILDRLDRAA